MPDFTERRDSFLKEYGEIRDKYQVDFLSFPAYIPTDHGTFETVLSVEVADLNKLATPSPFIKE